TDEDHSQSGRRARLGNDTLHALPAFVPDRAGDRVAIDDFRSHGQPNAIEVVMEIVVILQSNVASSRIGIRFGLLAILIRGTTKVSAARRKGKTIMQRRHSE